MKQSGRASHAHGDPTFTDKKRMVHPIETLQFRQILLYTLFYELHCTYNMSVPSFMCYWHQILVYIYIYIYIYIYFKFRFFQKLQISL